MSAQICDSKVETAENTGEDSCENSCETSCETSSETNRIPLGYTGSFSKLASPLDRFLMTTSARKAESEFYTKWIKNPVICPVKVLNRKQIRSDFMEITGHSMELLEQVREDAPSRRRSQRIKETSLSFAPAISLSDFSFMVDSEEDYLLDLLESVSDSESRGTPSKFLNGKRKRSEKSNQNRKRKALAGPDADADQFADAANDEVFAASNMLTVEESNQSTSTEAPKGYCVCNAVDYDGSFMIQCEKCDIWYHGDCIGLKEDDAEGIESFICRFCFSRKDEIPLSKPALSSAIDDENTQESPDSIEDFESETGSSIKVIDVQRKGFCSQTLVHQLQNDGVTV